MANQLSALVDRTLDHLKGTASEEINLLLSPLLVQATDFVDTVVFTYDIGGAVPGVMLSIDDESMYVLASDVATQSVTVLRGQQGSTAAAHSASTKIVVDPPWTRADVISILQDEVRSWGPQVFSIQTTTIAIKAGISGYDLGDPGPVYSRVRVFRDPPPYTGQGGLLWQNVGVPSDQSWPMIPAELRLNQSLSDFPSGNALIIKDNGLFVPSTVWVQYSKPFSVDGWTDTTDLIDDVGLDESDLDIPPLGAAWRLLSFRQPRRLFTQIAGQPRDAQEVPALSIMQAAMQFKEERDSRLQDAQIRLMQAFPIEINVS